MRPRGCLGYLCQYAGNVRFASKPGRATDVSLAGSGRARRVPHHRNPAPPSPSRPRRHRTGPAMWAGPSGWPRWSRRTAPAWPARVPGRSRWAGCGTRPAARCSLLAAGRGLVGSEDLHEVFLTLPGGARARPLAPGTLGPLLAKLPSWRAIGGISDGLLPDDERRTADRIPPSLEECLLATWPGPFGWLLIAEPLAAAEIGQIADQVARSEEEAAGQAERSSGKAVQARRLHLRHAELRAACPRACGGCACPGAGSTRRRPREWPGWSAPRLTWPACPTRWPRPLRGTGPARAPGRRRRAGHARRRRDAGLPVLRQQRAGRGAGPAAGAGDTRRPAGPGTGLRRHPGAGRDPRRSPSARYWTAAAARPGRWCCRWTR